MELTVAHSSSLQVIEMRRPTGQAEKKEGVMNPRHAADGQKVKLCKAVQERLVPVGSFIGIRAAALLWNYAHLCCCRPLFDSLLPAAACHQLAAKLAVQGERAWQALQAVLESRLHAPACTMYMAKNVVALVCMGEADTASDS
eukprot:1160146-Pelagomonas_calceolata.AAC.17